ncbi:hypothetical protein AB0756_39905 [Tolypothrix campylonemoides VB511288_2]|uniref:MarR family transcriptional regulator n=2 Tax=Nostocales TaxID=1161 RepID=A0ABW8X1P4_9CYAN
MTDNETYRHFQEIHDRYTKLGWLPRKDLLWLFEVLQHMLEQKEN